MWLYKHINEESKIEFRTSAGVSLSQEEFALLTSPLQETHADLSFSDAANLRKFMMEHMNASEYIDRRRFAYCYLTGNIKQLGNETLEKLKCYFNSYLIEVGVFSRKETLLDPSKIIDILLKGKLNLLSVEYLQFLIKKIDDALR